MAATILVRFVGRFMFVPNGSELVALAVDMAFNRDLRLCEHRPALVIDGRHVAQGREHAAAAIIPPVATATAVVDYVVFDLTGCDVSFEGVDTSNPVMFNNQGKLASIGTL